MNQWLKTQIEKRGLLKFVAVIWVMLLTSVVVLWFLIQPEELEAFHATLGTGVIGLVATVLAWSKNK